MRGFAEKLQGYRREKGMSQEKLAEVIGVSRQAVSKWESGQTYPEMDKMLALSRLFGVSLDHLVLDGPGSEESGEAPEYPEKTAVYLSRPHYEYKSKTTCFGLPLVHIHLGRGIYVAKGIIAVGTVAIGVLPVGVIAIGGLCFGAVSLGLISLAGLALGLLLAVGGLACGALAAGGVAVGIIAVGGLALGMYSFGGCAVASRIAIGGYASGHIAVGESVRGAYTWAVVNGAFSSVNGDELREAVNREYPLLWKPFVNMILSIFK
ncbi:helix-turn-helix transcriptional regulator [Paenibacillus tengchongensis]|uniref:helix-turn-helix transcriptional regulator n=1 Tax=Paenibacillus tengchongensis TaxID=2608684 RepID=UPI00124BD74C|nr:helix-turn-helix transcriptional regulator [Paenibacillus tengchongensis]